MVKTDNLTPWKKGESGNPKGHPGGGMTWADTYTRILVAEPGEETPVFTNKDLLAKLDFQRALEGHDPAINRIQDRTEGKPLQTSETKNENHTVVNLNGLEVEKLLNGDNT